MKKLDLQTPDFTEANIAKIAQLFPHVVTEAEDEDGKLVKKVDFDLLRQELSKDIVEDTTERYRLDRPGKKRSILKANTPITKTLRPVKEDSVNWDTTENLYLEGDNFEILKILQESYLGKIKMIYLDPPYNTGNDFVYKDDFKVSKDNYEEEIGVKDESGGKLFRNTDTNGRYHSDRLSMMYERLVIARDLLKEDGVIYISIDDHEVHNLRKMCDEIFGEENFVADVIRKTKSAGNNDATGINIQHENCLIFAKNKVNISLRGLEKNFDNYTNEDNDPNGPWNSSDPTANDDGRKKKNDFEIVNPYTGKVDMPGKGRHRRFNKAAFEEYVKNGRIVFRKDHSENMRGFFFKRYKNELQSNYNALNTLEFCDSQFMNQGATREFIKDFGSKVFEYSKPVGFMKQLVFSCANNNDIILDFFPGSSTTAHAVMQLNAEDGGTRKFIMAQLPEETDPESEAYKAGYKYITEIGKERIRRAGKKILEDNKDTLTKRETPLDIGFRVYKTDTSNMKDVYYHPSQIGQDKLGLFVSNVKDDRTPEDLLTQVMLDLGLTLDISIEEKKIKGNKVFFVAGNSLVACFDQKIDFAIVDEIAESQPLKVVFRDASFADDKDRINVETRMKRLSPETIVSVI